MTREEEILEKLGRLEFIFRNMIESLPSKLCLHASTNLYNRWFERKKYLKKKILESYAKEQAYEFGKFILRTNAKAIAGGLPEIQKLPKSINEWYDTFIKEQP